MERDLTVQQPQFGRSARLYGHKPRSSVGRRVRQGDGLAARWAPPNLGLHRNRAVPPDNGVESRFRAERHVSRPFVDPVKTPDMGGQVLAEVLLRDVRAGPCGCWRTRSWNSALSIAPACRACSDGIVQLPAPERLIDGRRPREADWGLVHRGFCRVGVRPGRGTEVVHGLGANKPAYKLASGFL